MTKNPYQVGYGRPPLHSRFRKGQSGNPGGKPKPENPLKQAFRAAFSEALNSDETALREEKSGKAIESMARQIALHAVDGRPSAQRLVLAILELEAPDAGVAADEEMSDPLPASPGAEEFRELLGDRYEEFRKRYDAAVATGSADDLQTLAEDFERSAKFPQSGNF
jgi:hypothetical protein